MDNHKLTDADAQLVSLSQSLTPFDRTVLALSMIDDLLGLLSIEVEGYTVTAIDQWHGGGWEIDDDNNTTHVHGLPELAAFLLAHTSKDE
jgi:hypothetical protein